MSLPIARRSKMVALAKTWSSLHWMPSAALRELEPEFLTQYKFEFEAYEPLESRLETDAGLHPDDAPIFEAFFDSLPKHFARGADEPAPERPAQRALGHAVEETLASSQFLIADAPTGTGKTLAYLAPLLLWAQRNQVRAGLSTYTRALQEQAFLQEVPRAIALLHAAGLPQERTPRVSMLKGRSNYICGRAIGDARAGARRRLSGRRARLGCA